VILTTFEVVRSQWAAWKQAADAFELKFAGGLPGRIPVRPFCPLNVAKFGLYIVDEIGKIGNAQTQTSRSIRAIHARKRIGATGTIIQNDYDELQCLMSFLLVEPWCNPVAFRKVRIRLEDSRVYSNAKKN
jgi:SNF2 family DNA or RNA helicase